MYNSHILIVDDEESIVRTLAGLLRDEGFKVSCAARWRAGFDLIHTEVPRFSTSRYLAPRHGWYQNPAGV